METLNEMTKKELINLAKEIDINDRWDRFNMSHSKDLIIIQIENIKESYTKQNMLLNKHRNVVELLQSIGLDPKFYNCEEIKDRLQLYPNGVYVRWMMQYFPNENEAIEAIEITEGHTRAMLNGQVEIKDSPYICNGYTNDINLIDDTSIIEDFLNEMEELEDEPEEDI